MTRDRIISFLKRHDGYISGEQISRSLKISRSAVWKVMRDLRGDGYDIEAATHCGYRLVKSPDLLYSDEISSGLSTKILGRPIIYLEQTTSTMGAAMDLAVNGSAEGTMVIAETQTKGKGRLGRSWVSPKGQGLYFSLIFCPKLSVGEVSLMTLMSAVAVCQTVREMTPLEAKIKWPNDILVRGRKLSGILMELNADMDGVKFVILGIGLNINTPLKSLPAHAASLKSETRKIYSRVAVLQALLKNLETWYHVFQHQGSKSVLQQWRQWSDTLGRHVRLEDQQGVLEGMAVDVDESGRLLLEDKSGRILRRMTGDVVNVR